MNLESLYKQAVETDSRKFEVMKSDGMLSGHHITLIDPFGGKAARLTHMFDRAIAAKAAAFETDNPGLLESCKQAEDFTEYNLKFEEACQDVRDAFACELVESWDFDNEFNQEALSGAIKAFRFPLVFSLERQIINAYRNLLSEHAKK